MSSHPEGYRKYLVLLPVVFLLLNAYYFKDASEQIRDSILNEKRYEMESHVMILAAVAEQDRYRPWIENAQNIIEAVNYMDEPPTTFACAYKRINGEWTPIGERSCDTVNNPFKNSHFRAMIEQYDSGHLEVPFARDGEEEAGYVYFKYMPMYETPENRYLVVMTTFEQSLATPIPMWVSAGQWGSSVLTFLLNVILVIMIARNKKREGGELR